MAEPQQAAELRQEQSRSGQAAVRPRAWAAVWPEVAELQQEARQAAARQRALQAEEQAQAWEAAQPQRAPVAGSVRPLAVERELALVAGPELPEVTAQQWAPEPRTVRLLRV